MAQFDQLHNRLQTNSIKWDTLEKDYQVRDLSAFWVADMDFQVAPAIQQALGEYVATGIYGYHLLPDSLYEAIISWQKRRHGYDIQKEAILVSSGVVPSLVMCIESLTRPGDAILIHDPVYPPFAEVVENNHRQLIRSSLMKHEGKFEMDLHEMETLIIDHQIKLFILCNPQNPGGRVWSNEELKQLGLLCQKHHVLVISDEIHQDLILAPNHFTSFQTVDESFAEFSVILTSATKTFNLAGVKLAMIFAKNRELREKIKSLQQVTRQDEVNTFGIIATQAAYDYAEDWLEELLVYLKMNVEETCAFFSESLPKVTVMQPEGTYLIWLDFSAYGLTDEELHHQLIYEAGVVLNKGATFGSNGKQHVRMNVACSNRLLKKGLTQIKEAFLRLA